MSVGVQLVLMLVMFGDAANEYCLCSLPLPAIHARCGVSTVNLDDSTLLCQ